MRTVITVQVEGVEPDDMLTEEAAAKLLGVSRNMLNTMRHTHRGPKLTIVGARTPMYRVRDLIEFAEKRVKISWR